MGKDAWRSYRFGLIALPALGQSRKRERGQLVGVMVIAFFGIFLAVQGHGQPLYWAMLIGGSLGLALLCLHGLFCLASFTGDEYLLPLCGYLCALSLVILGGGSPHLALRQLQWVLIGLGLVPWFALPRYWVQLGEYRYLSAIMGLALLLLTAIFGKEQGGAKLWLAVGPLQFQPGEIVRLALGIFLAAMFSENQRLFSHPTARLGPISIPEPRYLVPLLVMWALFLFVLVVQKDLGSALLYYSLFSCLGFVATGQGSYLVVPTVLGGIGGVLVWMTFAHIRLRFLAWLDPWKSPLGSGYQIIQAMFALANGGWLGRGLGRGYAHTLPAAHTDLPLAIVGEELGFAGLVAVLTCHFLLVSRGLVVSYRCGHGFFRLLGLSIVVSWGLSVFLVNGGMLRLLPLTGLVTPFVSYGGSAMITNFLCLGLLLNVSREELWRA